MPIRMSGLVSGLDTESIIKELMAAQSQKKTKIENKITTHEWKTEKWQDLNKKLYSFYTGSLSKVRLQGSYQTKKVSSADETKVKATANGDAVIGTHQVRVDRLASAQFVTGNQLGTVKNQAGEDVAVSGSTKLSQLGVGENTTIKIASGDKEVALDVTAETTVNDFLTACKDAGINATYDTAQKRFFLSSGESGADHAFSITSTTKNADGTQTSGDALQKLGLGEVTYKKNADGTLEYETNGDFALKEASDSVIELNGAILTNSSNTISANGITFELNAVTAGTDNEYIAINVSQDTQAVYDMVKNFINDYNELLGELNDAYYAESSYGYDPLTSEQREAMSDEDIEKWEAKIKDALLRRDSTVGSLISAMKTTMTGSIDYNGQKYSLSSLGIMTTDYTEKGKLHIYGNADDETTSGREDKLMAAIEEDPDLVMSIITELSSKLYSTFGDKMKSSTTSSALTFYEDKQMKTDLTKYQKELSTMEDKLSTMEENYYKQFTAMETALSKLNSQSSSISSLFGGSM